MIRVSKEMCLVMLSILVFLVVGLQCSRTTGEPSPFSSGLNGDNSLKSLILSGNGSLNQDFNPQVLNYTYTVKESVDSITVTPETNYRFSQITVNGAVCQSGTASTPIPLAIGNSNTLIIQITAEVGSVLQYAITVIRSKGESDGEMENANLSELSIGNTGTLNPAFNSGSQVTTYSVNVDVPSISLKAIAAMASRGAVVAISLEGVSVDDPSKLELTTGHNAIIITVTAPDGTTKKVYTLNVTNAPVADDDAKLASLVITGVSLVPSFNPDSLTYQITIPQTTEQIDINAVARSSKASISFLWDGTSVTNQHSIQIIASGTLIAAVTAVDGSTKRNYTIAITKTTSPGGSGTNLKNIEITTGTHNSKRPIYQSFDDFSKTTFNPAHTNYAAVVYACSSITIKATAEDAALTSIVFNNDGDGAHTSGVKTKTIKLSAGVGKVTPVTITVTGKDASKVKQYTIEVKLLNIDEFYWGIYARVMSRSLDRWSVIVPNPSLGLNKTINGFASGDLVWTVVANGFRGKSKMVLSNYCDGNDDQGTTPISSPYNDNCGENTQDGFVVNGTMTGDVSLVGDGLQTGGYAITTPWGDSIGSIDLNYVLKAKKTVEDSDSYSNLTYMGIQKRYDFISGETNYPYPFKTGYDWKTPWDDGIE